ncbi:MAG: outer membrane protein assembly factor BamB [Acidovorax sp.]
MMLRRSALAVCVLSVALTGCSYFDFGGSKAPKPAEIGTFTPVLGVRQAWTAKIGPMGRISLTPQVNGTLVTLASGDGTVAAIDVRTGGDLWRTNVGKPLSAGVGTDGKRSAVVTQDNELVVLADGREAWRKSLPAQVFTAPLVAGERVFVLAADRSLTAYDGATGKRLWTQQRPGEPLVLRHAGVLMPLGDTLVAGMSGRLVGYNPDNGSIKWEAPIATARGTNDVERLVELVGHTSRVGESVCARAFQTAVGCVNTDRATVAWSQTANGATGVSGDERFVFGSESNGNVMAWKRADGSRAWTSDRLLYRHLTAPLVLGRAVVMGDDTGSVFLLNKEDGALLNRLTTDGSGIAAEPVAAGDTLVVVTRNGGVYGFRPE